MQALTPDECRTLGVLIEKAQTTPQQYPLTLNALVAGCNQKNNREPVMEMDEDRALAALDGLRAKGFVHEVLLSGSRVAKFRHVAREALGVSTSELVILAELLLRGPQTVGELRGRAERMHPLESLQVVENILQSLITRPEPMVRPLAPAPGTRAARYAQLLCPDLHPLDASPAMATAAPPNAPAESGGGGRLDRLEAEVASLRRAVESIAQSLGLPDPMRK
jgi:uncharacterized protein YceH (UPF0502 family)